MRRLFRKTLNWVTFMFLIGAVASAGYAAEGLPLLPQVLQFESGGNLFQVDYSDYFQARTRFSEEGGCYEIRLTGTLENGAAGAALPSLDDLGSMTFLAGDVDETGSAGATRVALFTRTTCLSIDGVRIIDEAGPDQFEMELPWSSLKEDPQEGIGVPAITVRINGYTELLDSATVDALAAAQGSGSDPAWLESRPEFISIADRFHSLRWYGRVLPLFQEAQFRAASRFRLPDLEGAIPLSCWKPCTMCALNAAGTIVGGTALAASCASTFGATCVGGAVAVVRMAAGTLIACDDCRECRGGGGGGKGGECPKKYHECCKGKCCSDENPPKEC